MGLEAKPKVEYKNATVAARVHLDSNKLDVYLKPALHIPFAKMRSVVARDGALCIDFDQGSLTLRLGKAAERWAQKIRQPKGRLDKLGVTAADLRVVLIGAHAPDFEAELAERVSKVSKRPLAGADIVFLRAGSRADLAKLPALREKLAPAGAIWIVREKRKTARLKESEAREAGRAAGLVDVKVVAFSDTLTADKYVVPVRER